MTTSVGHAALMKSTLKPGYEFDQLLVLGILVICSFHSMPYWAYAIVCLCLCYLAVLPSFLRFCFLFEGCILIVHLIHISMNYLLFLIKERVFYNILFTDMLLTNHTCMLYIDIVQNFAIDRLHTVL